jgi:hypothetical protein
MRGQFIRGDGLGIPNNVSQEGARMILAAAFRNSVPSFFMAMVNGTPSPVMTMANMQEPTIGANGYQRVAIPRTAIGWPSEGVSGGDRYIESQLCVFEATGGNFSKPVNRLALVGAGSLMATDPVFALSESFNAELLVTPATPLLQRQFRYRIYL